jgi:metal-responsive CopG/Arc/MetJ family transcriptional regulator
MGRHRKNPDRAGVCITLPADLLAEIDRLADAEFCSRAEAIRTILRKEFAAIRGTVLGAPIDG